MKVLKKKSVFLTGKVIIISDSGVVPDDSDNESRLNEQCFDVQYSKYKSNTFARYAISRTFMLCHQMEIKIVRFLAFKNDSS